MRPLSDGFSGDAVVALLGQAPREWVVTTGLVQGIAPAMPLGTAAALVYGLREDARPRFGVEDDRLNQPPGQRRTIAGLVGPPLTLVFVVTGWFVKRQVARRRYRYRFKGAVAGGAR